MMATNDNKYAIDDGRHHKNRYKDYSSTHDDEIIDRKNHEIHDEFKKKLMTKIALFVEKLEDNKREWYDNGDVSIYTGTAGIAQLYYRLGKTLRRRSYTQRAEELIEKSLLDEKSHRRVSYLAGRPGPLALGAVVHHGSGNNGKSMKMIEKLKSYSRNALVETSNELLYGKVGYLYALLFVNVNVSPRSIDEELIKQIISRILQEGRDYSIAHKLDTPIMYEWHEKEYIGGAHGLAGILYVLLQARDYLTNEQLTKYVEPALNYLMKIRFSSGNFPSSMGNRSDKLVHWCHGAPSMTMLFALASQVFENDSFVRVAEDCGETVWARGLLKKGCGLCHGVSGNVYTFIALHQLTKNPKHLYRACKFSEWSMKTGEHGETTPDRPWSLFEGLAGTIYMLNDLCDWRGAKFPGYTL